MENRTKVCFYPILGVTLLTRQHALKGEGNIQKEINLNSEM
jgi:hypothetical protein